MAKAVKKNTDTIDLDKIRRELKNDIISLDTTFDYFLTGNPMFDAFVGSGGFPKYQMEYIWGTNSIGKSTLAIQILASYQKQHGDNCIVIYFDREESLTKARLEKLGVDVSKVIIINPEHIEYITEKVNQIAGLYSDKNVDLFVIWDTIAQTPSKEETEGYDKIGTQARSLANMFKRVSFAELNLTMFALNQHRETISSNAYAPKEPPGGNATKHKSFLTLNGTSKKSDVWGDGKNVGKCTTLTSIKSKIISPHRKMVFEYTYVHGYDAILTLIRFMWKEMKVLKKVNRGWQFADESPDAKYTLKSLYEFMLTDESVPRWKECINGVYDDLYGEDDPQFVQEAKDRIFNYYFENNKMHIDRFTSVTAKVVTPNKKMIDEDAMPDELSIEGIVALEEDKG